MASQQARRVEQSVQTECASPAAALPATSRDSIYLPVTASCTCLCHAQHALQTTRYPCVPTPVVSRPMAGLGHGRVPSLPSYPFSPRPNSNRIVSLPETRIPERPLLVQPRVVSLPSFLHDPSLETIDDLSGDFSFTSRVSVESSLGDSIISQGVDTNDRIGVLRTPSPDKIQRWTNWPDSPPKPIPALHGPLSLPYARCPSGAEGTVIEGEQPSKMIWGLDEAPSVVRTRPQKATEVVVTAPSQAQCNSDLSAMTSAFSHTRLVEVGASVGAIQAGREQLALLQLSQQRRLSGEQATAHSVSAQQEAPLQLHSRLTTGDLPGVLSGFRLDNDSDYSRARQRQLSQLGHGQTNPSATLYAFKNHNAFDLPVSIDQPRLQNGAELSTQDYNSPTFLTPPLTVSSAQWTPQFSDTPGTPYTPDIGVASVESGHSLGLFSYHPPRAEEPFSKAAGSGLRIASRPTLQPYGSVEESLHIKDRPIQLPLQKYQPAQPAPHYGGRPQQGLPLSPSPTAKPTQPGVSNKHLVDRRPPHRRKLSDQESHLKSVPLTRLLQRKLASVAEEDPSALERDTPPRRSRYPHGYGSPSVRGQAAPSSSGARTSAGGKDSPSTRASRQAMPSCPRRNYSSTLANGHDKGPRKTSLGSGPSSSTVSDGRPGQRKWRPRKDD